MAGAEAGPVAEVVDVDLAGVAGHGLCEAEDVGASGAQVGVPEPEVGRELGVVPGVAADVVAPLVPGGVVRVHDVAVVPEAVPAAHLDLVLVVREQEVQVVLDLRPGRGGAVDRGEEAAEDARTDELGRRGDELREGAHGAGLLGEGLGAGSGVVGPEDEFAGACDAVRGAEAGLVVLVGDLQAVELVGVGVLAHAVVVEAQVHRFGLGRPEPEGDLGGVGVGAADVELGGELLPEVAQSEGEPAARAAHVSEAGGAPAAARGDPAVALLGALAQREAVGRELAEGVVAPGGDAPEAGGDALVPGGGVGQLRALELGRLDGRSRVAAQSGDALDGFAEHAVLVAADADVPVVRLVAHRDGEADTEAADEVAARLAGFLGAVEGDGVHHAERFGARVEVEPDGEREPGAVAVAVLAVDADDGTDGPALFDLGLADGALEAFVLLLPLVAVLDLALADEDEAAVLGDLGGAPGEGGDERGAGLADLRGDDSGGDGDRAAAVLDGDLVGGGGGFAGGEGELLGAAGLGADRVGGPLQGAVGPFGGGPGLDGDVLAVGGGEGELLVGGVAPLGPGDAEGGSGCGAEAVLLQPVDLDGALVGLAGGGGCLLGRVVQRPGEGGGRTGDGGCLEDGTAGDRGHHDSNSWRKWA